MNVSEVRVGVDIGGTFTDVALHHSGGLATCKVLTNYSQPEQAILDGIGIATKQAGIAAGDIAQVIHGTTLVTNSLIERRAPVSVRHVLGHLVPDVVLGALHQALPDTVPAEGSSALWNIQISARASDPESDLPNREVLMFNSGGTGARPAHDGLSATAFPSGVSTMSVEATEHVGPITVWRKDLREGSGGAGEQRGGLGQTIEIEPREGYDFYFNAMFDRIENPARGRNGGGDGAAGKVALSDGTTLRGKGRQLIKNGQRLRLSLPGGGGYGAPKKRDREQVAQDERAGLISSEQAAKDY